jgi:hypothetical protein
MGREPSFYSHLSRLEHGRFKYPSLVLVADFLRACRASFSDLLPVLDTYTDKPPVRETRAREYALAGLAGDGSRDAVRLAVYDRKTAEARRAGGQKPVLPWKRAAALSRQLAAVREQRALAAVVEAEVTRLGVNPTMVVRKVALDYARMVWKAMRLTEGRRREGEESKGKGKGTSQGAEGGAANSEVKVGQAKGRKKTGRPPKTREQRLADARARFLELAPGILPDEALKHVEAKVVVLYDDVHRLEKRKQ